MAVAMQQLLIFTNQFSEMIKSDLPLIDVLDNLANETPQKVLKSSIEDVSDAVQQGVDLGEALARHPSAFNDIYVNVVRSGMLSGNLASALIQIGEYLDKTDAARRALVSALSYPILVLVAFFLVFNGMTYFILPRFAEIFSSFDADLPVITQWLMDVGAAWRENALAICVTIGVLAGSFLLWTRTPAGHATWDRYKLNIPLLGPILRKAALARFLRTFAIQIQNEVPILRAIDLAAASSGNKFIEDSTSKIADSIEKGESITESFRRHKIFGGIILQMIAAGEESGEISSLLMSAASYFERLLETSIQTVTGLINPILTILIGMGIAGMMIAIFLPIFDMGSAVH